MEQLAGRPLRRAVRPVPAPMKVSTARIRTTICRRNVAVCLLLIIATRSGHPVLRGARDRGARTPQHPQLCTSALQELQKTAVAGGKREGGREGGGAPEARIHLSAPATGSLVNYNTRHRAFLEALSKCRLRNELDCSHTRTRAEGRMEGAMPPPAAPAGQGVFRGFLWFRLNSTGFILRAKSRPPRRIAPGPPRAPPRSRSGSA